MPMTFEILGHVTAVCDRPHVEYIKLRRFYERYADNHMPILPKEGEIMEGSEMLVDSICDAAGRVYLTLEYEDGWYVTPDSEEIWQAVAEGRMSTRTAKDIPYVIEDTEPTVFVGENDELLAYFDDGRCVWRQWL